MKPPTATSSEFSKQSYVKVAVGDHDDEHVKKDTLEQKPMCSKICLVAALLCFIGITSMHFFHEVVRNERMSEFMHFGAPKHPCPHHLRFSGHPHHIDYGDSSPSDVDMLTMPLPPMDKEMIMVPLPPMDKHMMMHHLPPMDKHMKFPLPPMDKHMKHPLPPMNKNMITNPLKEENSITPEDSSSDDNNDIDVWERIANMWINKLSDNSSDTSSDSSDSSDDSEEKGFWEGIADIWEWMFEDDDSSDSSDSSSSDNQSPKDVWEQVAATWKSSSQNAESRREVAMDDMNN
jgi:hypothetical protein